MIRIGDKVRNIHDNTEGILVHSTFGVSVRGVQKGEDGQEIHFQTLGHPIEEYEKEWKKVNEFKYNMNDYKG